MKPESKLFYKGNLIEYVYDPDLLSWVCPEGTFCFNPNNYYPWTRLIRVRKGLVWAKVALRNVPKSYRLMLVLFQ